MIEQYEELNHALAGSVGSINGMEPGLAKRICGVLRVDDVKLAVIDCSMLQTTGPRPRSSQPR